MEYRIIGERKEAVKKIEKDGRITEEDDADMDLLQRLISEGLAEETGIAAEENTSDMAERYRLQCKNEALELFSKWFYDLWD